jgi:AraC family transcriptional regulator, regulatory protein of adaptative response / methylated-DNA-[protein]-cysteine methyltransferase
VREDGTPGGWRWGVERKRALLKQEEQQHGANMPAHANKS